MWEGTIRKGFNPLAKLSLNNNIGGKLFEYLVYLNLACFVFVLFDMFATF